MKYILSVALLSILLMGTDISANSQSLKGLDIFNTAAFECSIGKDVQEVEWVNEGKAIRIYTAKLWLGASGGTNADIGVIVYRKSDRSIFFHENWDRYADPTGLHVSTLSLAPNYMTIEQGDSVSMAYWCESFNGTGKQAHVIVTAWYR